MYSFNCLSCISSIFGSQNLLPKRITMLQSFRKHVCNADDEYQKVITMLNSLQSDKRVQDAKMVRHPSQNMPKMHRYLVESGIELNDLEQKLSVIHVSGTKGKGSTCAYCECILRQYGYKTGFFSSPHLCSVRERIRINGELLSKRKFAGYFRSVYDKLKQNEARKTDPTMPHYFMFLTLMAFKVFIEENIDVAIIEVGIGGEYDCTNVLKNTSVVGITSLGYDHVRVLGHSIEEIAWQKAGIIKSSSVVVTAAGQPENALKVLQSRAVEKGRTLYVAPDFSKYKLNDDIVLGISGPVQKLNASLALQLINAWMNSQHYLQNKPTEIPEASAFSLSEEMKRGLTKCSWPGRTQLVRYSKKLSYYLDGAHTGESIQYCLQWYEQAIAPSSSMKKVLVFNMIGDRDSKSLLKHFIPYHFDLVCFCTNKIESLGDKMDSSKDNWSPPSNEEEKRAEENRNHWLEQCPNADEQNTKLFSNATEVHEFMQKSAHDADLQILVTGSLHLVGIFLGILGWNDDNVRN